MDRRQFLRFWGVVLMSPLARFAPIRQMGGLINLDFADFLLMRHREPKIDVVVLDNNRWVWYHGHGKWIDPAGG